MLINDLSVIIVIGYNVFFINFTMNSLSIIQQIYQGNKELLCCLDAIQHLESNQESLLQVVRATLENDKYLDSTQKLWKLIKEDITGLVKYDLYSYVLNQSKFNPKTARYICIKEREFKKLNSTLLGKCATEEAVNFVLESYNLGISNIVQAIAESSLEEQLPSMNILLSRLNSLQTSMAVNKFVQAYIDDYPKDLNLVIFMLKQNKNWPRQVLEHEKIQKLMLYSNMEEKFPAKSVKIKTNKI